VRPAVDREYQAISCRLATRCSRMRYLDELAAHQMSAARGMR